jgi:hypothetical protein
VVVVTALACTDWTAFAAIVGFFVVLLVLLVLLVGLFWRGDL